MVPCPVYYICIPSCLTSYLTVISILLHLTASYLCDLEGLLSFHVPLLRRLAALLVHQLLRLVRAGPSEWVKRAEEKSQEEPKNVDQKRLKVIYSSGNIVVKVARPTTVPAYPPATILPLAAAYVAVAGMVVQLSLHK